MVEVVAVVEEMAEELETTSPYKHFVETQEKEKELQVDKITVSLELSKNFKSLISTYEYNIKAIGDGEHSSWYRIIPEPADSIKECRAWGDKGSLESTLSCEDHFNTRLDIKFPVAISKKGPNSTHFFLSYATPSHTLLVNHLFSRLAFFHYWYVSTTKTAELLIKVSLPSGSKVLDSNPLTELNSPILYRQNEISPKNLFSISLAVSSIRLSYNFWRGAFLLLGPVSVASFIQVLLTPTKQLTIGNFIIPIILASLCVLSGIIYFTIHKIRD